MIEIQPPQPRKHADHQCAVSLLMEMAADYFSELRPRTGSAEIKANVSDNDLYVSLERCEILHAAAATIADFAASLMDGLHGRGCPVREERDAAARQEGRSPIQAGPGYALAIPV
jgi:hypothetical protein